MEKMIKRLIINLDSSGNILDCWTEEAFKRMIRPGGTVGSYMLEFTISDVMPILQTMSFKLEGLEKHDFLKLAEAEKLPKPKIVKKKTAKRI